MASAPKRILSRSSASAPSPLCRRSPASPFRRPRELEIVALTRHPHRDVPDPGPGVQPRAESVEGAVIRGHRAPGEADSST